MDSIHIAHEAMKEADYFKDPPFISINSLFAGIKSIDVILRKVDKIRF